MEGNEPDWITFQECVGRSSDIKCTPENEKDVTWDSFRCAQNTEKETLAVIEGFLFIL